MKKVYINSLGKTLPNLAITNDNIEDFIGRVGGKSSPNKGFVLRQNRIESRYYAIDKNQKSTHSNAELAANAINNAIENSEINKKEISFLSSATTLGDLLVPGLASQIQAELDLGPIEIANFQSVCASSLMAFKNCYLQIKSGEHNCGIVSGSELASKYLKASFYEKTKYFKQHNSIPLEQDYLRFTLSDGAGAAVLEDKPNSKSLSLEIVWIDLKSYSHRFENCMIAGKSEKYWGEYASPSEAEKEGAMVLRQDFSMLDKMIQTWIAHYLDLIDKNYIAPDTITYFCSHFSAHSLKLQAQRLLKKTGAHIPEEKWFTNLYKNGNTGTASIFIILEELFYSGRLKKDDTIFCHVPESGRCLNGFMMLKVI